MKRQFEYVVPETMPPEFVDDFHNDMKIIQQMYQKWRDRGLKKEDARFVLAQCLHQRNCRFSRFSRMAAYFQAAAFKKSSVGSSQCLQDDAGNSPQACAGLF